MTSAVAVRERPILFSGEMVRAILDGRKSQTRRAIKAPRPDFATLEGAVATSWRQRAREIRATHPTADDETIGYLLGARTEGMQLLCNRVNDVGLHLVESPHGVVGDRLWVRETFAQVPRLAGCERQHPSDDYSGVRFAATWDKAHCGWRPSIFMPRWASRITLEITNVRVERVQSISYEDAKAEGMGMVDDENRDEWSSAAPPGETTWPTLQQYYERLWDDLNAKRGYSWESNPWVFVIDFKRVTV